MKAKALVPFIVVALLSSGIGFFGGKTFQASQKVMQEAGKDSVQFGQGGPGGFRGPGGRGGRGGGGFVGGQILSKDATSITIKLRDGGSTTVYTSASTTASKPASIPLDSLVVGDEVMVTGRPNDDGSTTASSIQVRPPQPQGKDEQIPAATK